MPFYRYGLTGGYQRPALNAPTISISGSNLTITNPSTNGNFVGGYKVYSDSTLIATVTTTTVDLLDYITTAGKYSITAKCYGTNFNDSTASEAVSYKLSIIGFTGITNSTQPTPDLTFTDDISAVSKYSTATSDTNVNVTNALDSYFPYSEIAEFTDASGNVFVKYPKMWIKWVLDASGNIDGIKISDVQVDSDYFIPDAFLDPSDGTSYLNYFALGKYEASGDSTKMYSKNGQACYVNMTREVARAASRAYGTSANYYAGYQQIDFSMFTLYNFLCMLYFKTPNIQNVYGGRTGKVSTWGSTANTGSCDGLSGMNGWNTTTDCVKMLGIENPFGNINKWIDGVYFSSATIYAHRLPQNYDDSTSNGIDLGFSRPTITGSISKLRKGTSDTSRSYVYCHEASGITSIYVGDCCVYASSGVVLCAGGSWSNTSNSGLWYLSGDFAATAAFSRIGGRLAYRPVT